MLGSFHRFMNLLGAIGFLMSGSGLQDILKQIFADNAVVHLSGKAVSCAFRVHLSGHLSKFTSIFLVEVRK